MRAYLIGIAALALCGCTPPNTETTDDVAAVNGCDASANAPWTPVGAAAFQVSAATNGADCATATAAISIKDASGQDLYTQEFPTAQVMLLAGKTTVEEMNTALAEWIEPSSMLPNTAALPEWAAGAAQPSSGEFPFYPAEGVTRESYNALRARNVPLYCFVQGMESVACLAWENNAFTDIGAQSFPG